MKNTKAQNIKLQSARIRSHNSAQWAAVKYSLPDLQTSSPAVLEAEGDILQARHLLEDAMDYYNFAFLNGGDGAVLLNKLGLVALAMDDVPWARVYFQRVVKINPRSADGWNNLGTVEYLQGRPAFATANYERAVKLDPGRATLHCNLAAAYLGKNDLAGARKEMAAALKLDLHAFEHSDDEAGAATRVFSAGERGQLSFEIARLYARSGAEEQMLRSLAMASEAGFDIHRGMRKDTALAKYANDPRVGVLMHNAQALRSLPGSPGDVGADSAPSLASIAPIGGTASD